MNSTKYIINQLNNLIELFPQLSVRYEHNKMEFSHLIEVLPSSEFRDNKDFTKHETNIIIDFITEFPYEEIVFITEDDLIEVSNPIYEKQGVLFGKESKDNTKISQTFTTAVFSNLTQTDFEFVIKLKKNNSLSASFDSSIDQIEETPVEVPNDIDYALVA